MRTPTSETTTSAPSNGDLNESRFVMSTAAGGASELAISFESLSWVEVGSREASTICARFAAGEAANARAT